MVILMLSGHLVTTDKLLFITPSSSEGAWFLSPSQSWFLSPPNSSPPPPTYENNDGPLRYTYLASVSFRHDGLGVLTRWRAGECSVCIRPHSGLQYNLMLVCSDISSPLWQLWTLFKSHKEPRQSLTNFLKHRSHVICNHVEGGHI